jgi:hypothetical protein
LRQQWDPVDVILALRKDVAAFQRVSDGGGGDKQAFKEALRESVREELKKACMEALQRSSAVGAAVDDAGADRRRPVDRPGYLNIEPIVEYLTEREVIRPKLSRAQVRRLAKSVLREKQSSGEKQSSSEKEISS